MVAIGSSKLDQQVRCDHTKGKVESLRMNLIKCRDKIDDLDLFTLVDFLGPNELRPCVNGGDPKVKMDDQQFLTLMCGKNEKGR